MRNYKTQIYRVWHTNIERVSSARRSRLLFYFENCVLDVISFSIFTVQPQNVGRVHLRIAEENYYNGKRCSNKHPRDGMTIFCSIHLSWFHVTKSPRVGRDEKERGIFLLYSLWHPFRKRVDLMNYISANARTIVMIKFGKCRILIEWLFQTDT